MSVATGVSSPKADSFFQSNSADVTYNDDESLNDELDEFLSTIQIHEIQPVITRQSEYSPTEKMHSIIKEELLAQDMSSVSLKARVGEFSILRVFSNYFAIGTSKGLILLFDKGQKLYCILGSSGGKNFEI